MNHLEDVLADICMELGCEPDNEDILQAIANLRGALAWIYNSTEPDAIKHMSYEHLAHNVSELAKAALDGEFVDDMNAAAAYDRQKHLHDERRATSSVTSNKLGGE